MKTLQASPASPGSLPGLPLNRRRFLRIAAAATVGSIVPRQVLGGAGQLAPNSRITLAGIGLGGQGMQNLSAFLGFADVQVVAMCDVNRESTGYVSWNWSQGSDRKLCGAEPAKRLAEEHYGKNKPSGQFRGIRTYGDYRELLEKEDVDAVMIATPDHTHAVITMAALKRGRHVYCEKPMTWSVGEGRQVTEAARQANVATQLGNQGQAEETSRVICEILADGVIGPVHEVHVWSPARLELARLRRPAAGHAADPSRTGLGFMAGPRPLAALPPPVSSVDLAQLAGFRHRSAG